MSTYCSLTGTLSPWLDWSLLAGKCGIDSTNPGILEVSIRNVYVAIRQNDDSNSLNKDTMVADPSGTSLLFDNQFLGTLRSQMLRFARLQINDSHLAEDAVQEALAGALKNAGSFTGKAALKSWVFAILKNKIVDVLRKHQRLVTTGQSGSDDPDDGLSALLFSSTGHWQQDERPADWGNPHESLQNSHFWIVFETCLDQLPPSQARVFMMREFIELHTDEICSTVGLTVTNLNVMLYRARLRLRECLETRWFADENRPC